MWRLTVICVAFLTACGGVGRDDFVSAWIDADCERAARCGEYISKEACLDFELGRRAFGLDVGELVANVASSRTSYDSDEAAACIERLRNASCDRTSSDWRASTAGCAAVFSGEVATGGDCYLDAECRSGACAAGPCGSSCCVGTCIDVLARAHIGESCADRGCVDGAFCSANQVCAGLRPAGGSCQAQLECGYGLYCLDGACVDTPGRGEPCPTEYCENWYGDRCSPASGTCERLAVAGEPCQFNFDCQLPLLCDVSICVALPEVGERCLGLDCAAGAYCAAGVCAPRLPEGEACSTGDECTTYFCDSSGRCASPPVCG